MSYADTIHELLRQFSYAAIWAALSVAVTLLLVVPLAFVWIKLLKAIAHARWL